MAIWDYNPHNLDTTIDYSGILSNFHTLQRGVASGISMNDQLRNSMNSLQNQLLPVAQWYGTTPDKLTPQQVAQYQDYVQQNTGMTGWVNNNLGGWGNVFSGLQGLGNLYFGLQNLGLAKDQLALQQDAFNFNKGITTRNLANQIQAYNTSLEDRYRARAYTETGNADAYNDKIEKNKLSSKI